MLGGEALRGGKLLVTKLETKLVFLLYIFLPGGSERKGPPLSHSHMNLARLRCLLGKVKAEAGGKEGILCPIQSHGINGAGTPPSVPLGDGRVEGRQGSRFGLSFSPE